MSIRLTAILWVVSVAGTVLAQEGFEKDVVKTSAGDLEIVFVGHGSLMMTFGGKTIQIDPYGALADYGGFRKADLLLLTHEHSDHTDAGAIKAARSTNTVVILPRVCAGKVASGTVMTNGETRTVLGITVEAVPAYNIVHKRPDGQAFHPKGQGNGYVLTFGDKRLYIAGDTENTPEMKALKGIDVAFLPMNLPYTMTPEMVADAAMAFKPRVLYPYHCGETNPSKLTALLKGAVDIEVRVRKLK